mmetsp:Transcript_23292/g.53439  ORF Transcript_23292/g.53439 Transcript_23292/m.53439 type:complete len:334 (+) Transcript_23292:177-1178(+)
MSRRKTTKKKKKKRKKKKYYSNTKHQRTTTANTTLRTRPTTMIPPPPMSTLAEVILLLLLLLLLLFQSSNPAKKKLSCSKGKMTMATPFILAGIICKNNWMATTNGSICIATRTKPWSFDSFPSRTKKTRMTVPKQRQRQQRHPFWPARYTRRNSWLWEVAPKTCRRRNFCPSIRWPSTFPITVYESCRNITNCSWSTNRTSLTDCRTKIAAGPFNPLWCNRHPPRSRTPTRTIIVIRMAVDLIRNSNSNNKTDLGTAPFGPWTRSRSATTLRKTNMKCPSCRRNQRRSWRRATAAVATTTTTIQQTARMTYFPPARRCYKRICCRNRHIYSN